MKKIFSLLLILFLIITPIVSFGQMRKISDISIHNLKLSNTKDKINLSFEVVNNSSTDEKGLKYGILIKDRNDIVIDKNIINKNFNLKAYNKIDENINYDISNLKNIKSIKLFINNKNNIPVTASSIDNLNINFDKASQNKKIEKPVEYSCDIATNKKDGKEIDSIECVFKNKKDSLKLENKDVNLEIYRKSIFGKPVWFR